MTMSLASGSRRACWEPFPPSCSARPERAWILVCKPVISVCLADTSCESSPFSLVSTAISSWAVTSLAVISASNPCITALEVLGSGPLPFVPESPSLREESSGNPSFRASQKPLIKVSLKFNALSFCFCSSSNASFLSASLLQASIPRMAFTAGINDAK